MHVRFLRKTGNIIVQVKNPPMLITLFHFRVCGDIKRRYKYEKNRGNPNKFKQKRKITNCDRAKFTVPRPTGYRIKKTYNLQNQYLQPKE